MKPRNQIKPTTEMDNRLDYINRYMLSCMVRGQRPDMERVRREWAQAFAAGIISGSVGDHYEFKMGQEKIHDAEFGILLEALTRRSQCKTGCPEKITLKFPENNLTDDSLSALASALTHQRFPKQVIIDISGSKALTDAGAKELLAALQAEGCNKSVKILLPKNPRMIDSGLLERINEQLEVNYKSYQPEPEKPVVKKKSPRKPVKAKPAAEGKTAKKGLFAPKKKKDSAKKQTDKEGYTRLRRTSK